jgi:hypothetical protein
MIIDKKSIVKQWQFDEYNLRLYRNKGAFGPIYYKYTLDKRKPLLSIFFRKKTLYCPDDSLNACEVHFDLKRSFNICKDKEQHEIPFPKEKIDITKVKKIEVIKIDSLTTSKIELNQSQFNYFISAWNSKKKQKQGSPRIKFLISVIGIYGNIRVFNSDGNYLHEQNNNAQYEMSDKSFFGSIFN